MGEPVQRYLGPGCPRTAARPREKSPDLGLLQGSWWLSRGPRMTMEMTISERWGGGQADILKQ